MNRKPETRNLPVALTKDEFEVKAAEFAASHVELKEREESIKEAKKAMADEIKQMEKHLSVLAHIVDTRRELRTVPCTWRADYARNLWRLSRDDTGEEVETDTMSSNDLQGELRLFQMGSQIVDEETENHKQ